MTVRSDNPIKNQNDQLADFADRARMDVSMESDPNADQELRGLEETLVRLNRAFPREAMNENTIKRMQADFGIRRRRQETQERASRQTWLSSLFQSPVALALVTFVVVGVLIILSPSLTSLGTSTSGAAGAQNQPVGFLVIIGVALIFFALWIMRRK